MLLTILKKEVFESIYNYRFIFLAIVGITLIPIGLYVNEVSYSKRLGEYDDQVRLEAKAVSSAQVWDLLSGTVPLKGFLEPAPLAVFAQGLEGSLPQFYAFKPEGYEKGANPSGGGPASSDLGELDFLFMVQFIFSLIALVFGADIVSGEKELGTLRMVLSNSVPRDTVLLGKAIGGYAAIWLPFALAVVSGMLVLSFTSFPFHEDGILTRILLVFVTSSVFILINFLIGIMISCGTARTRTSLVAVVVVWTFLQLIVPKVGNLVAVLVHPIRTETVVSVEKSLAINALESEKGKVLGKQYTEIFGKDTMVASYKAAGAKDLEWNSFKEKALNEYKEKESEQIHSIDAQYEREKGIQQSIESDICLLSPSSAFDYLITDFCNTGFAHKEKYFEAVETYQETLGQRLFSMVERTQITFPSGRTGALVSFRQVLDLKSLPAFSVQRATLLEVFIRNAGSIISLTLWLIIPFAVAYKEFLKYDVR
jgi:ABC-2 type transport system permease protein